MHYKYTVEYVAILFMLLPSTQTFHITKAEKSNNEEGQTEDNNYNIATLYIVQRFTLPCTRSDTAKNDNSINSVYLIL